MNTAPTNFEFVDRLAAEYVLGTLRGSARLRLERWRGTSPLVEERCRFWEEGLMSLLLALRPVQPPAHVWQGIRARLNLVAQPRGSRAPLFALAAGVVAVAILGALVYWRILAPAAPGQVATISAPSGPVLWQIEVYGKAGETFRLRVHAGVLAAPPAGRDYELWALPKGGTPVSLGLLPYRETTARRALTVAQQQALANSAQLAVSVEPIGGSPTGQPTGAVAFVVPLRVPS
jgi:anti-sigma-K factor RskA